MRIKHYDHNINHNTGNYMIFFKRKISVIRKKKKETIYWVQQKCSRD